MQIDKKKKPRAYISANEARLAIQFAQAQQKPPEYEIGLDLASDKWLIMRLIGGGSARVPRPAWHRTSFRVDKVVWSSFVDLVRERGLTSCQVLRAAIEAYVGLEEQARTRRSPVYVR